MRQLLDIINRRGKITSYACHSACQSCCLTMTDKDIFLKPTSLTLFLSLIGFEYTASNLRAIKSRSKSLRQKLRQMLRAMPWIQQIKGVHVSIRRRLSEITHHSN